MPVLTNPDRDYRKAMDEHARHVMHGVISYCCDPIANSRAGPLIGGGPTIEIEGPDGVWRRYFVRLTETGVEL